MIDPALAFAALAVGLVIGLTGVGGGSLMTPVLVLGFGIPPAIAVGTDLVMAGITKAGGALSHAFEGHVDWRVTALLATGSVPATLASTYVLSRLPAGTSGSATVSTALGVMIVLTAVALLFRRSLQAWAARRAPAAPGRGRDVAAIALGAAIGAAVTLSSVGAGAIAATALMLLFPAMAATRIVGTDIAHAVPITLVAGIGHAFLGHVDTHLLLSLLAGSLPGIALGAQLSARLPDNIVRRSMAAVLLAAGVQLIAA